MISEQGNDSPIAFVDGAPVPFREAIQRCADILAASVQPVFAHIGADLSGTREAVLLAERTGGVLDHATSEALLRDLNPLRETGGLTTTPMEADVRADVVLLIGEIKGDATLAWLSKPARPHGEAIERCVVTVADFATEYEVLTTLAALRLLIRRPSLGSEFPALAQVAHTLRNAKFGVSIWSAAQLPDLAVEAIHGLVRDLNETTRFSTLTLSATDNGDGVQTICGWMTGFPMRTGFSRGWPEHDPWRYDARRLIAADETDCVVWISSLPGGAAPPVGVDILLDSNEGAVAVTPRIRIPVSPPGPGDILFDSRLGTRIASHSGLLGAAPTVAATLASVRERLEAAC
jgi:formylmethanofuran dehydrogenase subunit B